MIHIDRAQVYKHLRFMNYTQKSVHEHHYVDPVRRFPFQLENELLCKPQNTVKITHSEIPKGQCYTGKLISPIL